MHKIAFLLMPDFSHLSLALALEPLFVANWLAQRQLFAWSLLSVDGGPVAASNGLPMPVDAAPAEGGGYRSVFVVASFNPKQHAQDRRVGSWLRRLARFGVEIGGIETGSEILAAAGLLDGRDVAVHWDNLEGFQERYPKARARAQLYTLDADRPTCAGATAVLDFMLRWIAARADADLAAEVAQHFLLGGIRGAADAQATAPASSGATAHPAIRRSLALMQAAIEEPLTCSAIAARVGLSQRQLQRRFQQAYGTTMQRHYVTLRLAVAHKLLQQTDLPVTEVAVSAGFASLENFSRVYRSHFGRPPSTDRRQTTEAPVFRQPSPGPRPRAKA